ncbi:hypothetical protein CI610_03364 [invertebrate metagenome]|uniref:Polymerase nucleotidyl transferase domain-containing protein n=1 Tax=invertebrate metagenome TaxID=1711999 RepID=A0A2H9T398_9ZZZZ
MIDLRQKDHRAICLLAEKTFPVGTEIWAYGSRIKGTNHETSDLDLVVHFPKTLDNIESSRLLSDFIEALRESTIPIIVQVMAWHDIPDLFKKNIQDHYQALWPESSSDPLRKPQN